MKRPALAAVALAMALVSACVYPEHRKAEEAKAAYESCVREHSPEHRDCEVLWHTYQIELERYESIARARWSCDPAQDECPTRR